MSSNCFAKVNSQLSIMKFCYEYTAWRLRQNSAKQTRSSEIAPRLLLSSVQFLSPLTHLPPISLPFLPYPSRRSLKRCRCQMTRSCRQTQTADSGGERVCSRGFLLQDSRNLCWRRIVWGDSGVEGKQGAGVGWRAVSKGVLGASCSFLERGSSSTRGMMEIFRIAKKPEWKVYGNHVGEGMPNMCVRTELWPESCRNYGPKSHRPRGSTHTHIQRIHTSYTNGAPPSAKPSHITCSQNLKHSTILNWTQKFQKSSLSPGQVCTLSFSRGYTLYNNQTDVF